MFKKNSICKLIKNVKDLIASASFKEKHCLEKTAFTRNRKLSFQDIMYFVLSMPQKSLTTELDLFFGKKTFPFPNRLFQKRAIKYHRLLLKIFLIYRPTCSGSQTIPGHGMDTVYLPLTVPKLPLTTTKTTRLNLA